MGKGMQFLLFRRTLFVVVVVVKTFVSSATLVVHLESGKGKKSLEVSPSELNGFDS